MKIVSLILILSLFPVLAFAHPGHGNFHGTWLHFLTSDIHLVPFSLPLIAFWFMFRSYLKSKKEESSKT